MNNNEYEIMAIGVVGRLKLIIDFMSIEIKLLESFQHFEQAESFKKMVDDILEVIDDINKRVVNDGG